MLKVIFALRSDHRSKKKGQTLVADSVQPFWSETSRKSLNRKHFGESSQVFSLFSRHNSRRRFFLTQDLNKAKD